VLAIQWATGKLSIELSIRPGGSGLVRRTRPQTHMCPAGRREPPPKCGAFPTPLTATYDGILGLPPRWLPDPLRREFEATRNYLLDDYTPEEIKAFLNSRTKELTPGFSWSRPYLREITDKLDALLYIRHIVSLGEEEGIKAYLGKGGQSVHRSIVISERNREAAKKPRGDALQDLILEILKATPQATTREVRQELKKHEGCGVVERVSDSCIEWARKDGSIQETAISGLKDRVSRARKKVKGHLDSR